LKPYYEHAGICIYHGDCRDVIEQWEGLRTENFDLLLTDPPYGIDFNHSGCHGRFSTVGVTKAARQRGNHPVHGDDAPFDPAPWLDFPAVVMWGVNHFAARVPVGTTLVWIKRNDPAFGTFLSDAELAWMKGGCGVYCRRDLSMTAIANEREHPCQKPVGLMAWCFDRAKVAPGATVLDPFCGSGTTLIAALETGRKAIGIEIDERWVTVARQRLERWHAQGRLDFGTANASGEGREV
jgi:DNA modification methylase